MAKDKQQTLRKGAELLGIDLDAALCDRLLLYTAELLKWNRRINLVARETTEEQLLEIHMLDSLTLLPLLEASNRSPHLLDVGSGAGFPGLVLACALNDGRFTLVEPRQKRVTFLRHLIRQLGLSNTEVVADRVETLSASSKGLFTHITSRAVAEARIFLPLIERLATPETRVLLMLARQEILEEIDTISPGHWRLVEHRALTLPFSCSPRIVAVVSMD